MLTKRIIPCLDVDKGKVVKGVKFENLVIIDDPTELAQYYAENGADELVFYDITASHESRNIFTEIIKKVAATIDIPFTVGGGIRNIDDFYSVLNAGADKVSVNSAALARPELIKEAATRFGSQCVVLSMDVKKVSDGEWTLYINGGRTHVDMDPFEWAKKGEALGAGEIVVNSIDSDGVKGGFDCELMRRMSEATHLPIIASGGAGTMEHFEAVFKEGRADAGLAASVFHKKEIDLWELKRFLQNRGIPMRLDARYHRLNFDEKGLIPAIVQNEKTGQILMQGYMNEASLQKTLADGKVCFYSRSRQKLWTKGETSGNFLHVVSIYADCDHDALLIMAHPDGPTCHTGAVSCFHNPILTAPHSMLTYNVLYALQEVIKGRRENPIPGSYTNYLFDKGIDKILKKVGEESSEVIIASKNPEEQPLIDEISDLFYHLSVLMVERDVPIEAILENLKNRHRSRK